MRLTVQARTLGALRASLVVLCLCVVTLAAGAAHAAGPAVFSAESPAQNTASLTYLPFVSVTVNDPAGIASGSLLLNGLARGIRYVDYPIGHWEETADGCDTIWVVDDYRTATLVCDVRGGPPLSPGKVTVIASVTNGASVVSTRTWDFFADKAPVITTVTPTPDGLVRSLSPTISVTFTDEDASLGTLMTIDGQVVVPTFTAGTKTLSYKPSIPFESFSQHEVYVSLTDSRGSLTSRRWSFTVAEPIGAAVAVSDRSPVPGAVHAATTVPISVRIDSAATPLVGGSTSASLLKWDGVPLSTVRDNPIGYWDGDPDCGASWVITDPTVMTMSSTVAAATDGTHTITAHVVDAAGAMADPSWDIKVAVPPSASQFSPAKGTIDPTPLITAKISDNGGTPTVTMKIDGVDVASAYDHGTGLVSYTPPAPLSDPATHTVTLMMVDAAENTSSATWDFRLDSGSTPTFYNRVPAPGSVLPGTSTAISVRATSTVTLQRATARIKVNGVSYTTYGMSYVDGSTGIQINPVKFTDGPKNVTASIDNAIGASCESTWTFSVMVKPTVGAPTPYPNGTTIYARPTITFDMWDNTPGPLNVKLSLDGVPMLDEARPQGTVSWRPATGFANNSNHTVLVRVTDALGNFQTLSWQFNVVAAPPMSVGAECLTCHDAATHPFANCGGCHVDDPMYDPHGANRFGPIGGTCHGCHGWEAVHSPTGVLADCDYCHSGPWPQIPRHTPTTVDDKHLTSSTQCVGCHSLSLLTEHGKYPVDSDFKYQCDVCHSSESAAVRSAIQNNDTACSACHTGFSHPHPDAAITGVKANAERLCTDCHSTDLTVEHAKLTSAGSADPCGVCHTENGPRDDIGGAWGLACDTPACHGAASTRPVHSTYCQGCHSTAGDSGFAVAPADFTADATVDRATACPKCHTPALAGSHPKHYPSSNCGATCHPGWGASAVAAVPRHTTSNGSFNTTGSAETTPGALHRIHSIARWPGGIGLPSSQCASCHAVASCTACHEGDVSHGHGSHGSVGNSDHSAVGAWGGKVAEGVSAGDQTQITSHADTSRCGATECHGGPRTGEGAPKLVEDRTTATGAVVKTGSWKDIFSTNYTAGRMAYGLTANSTLSTTFTGNRVVLVTDAAPARGIAGVYIDGVLAANADLYSATTRYGHIAFDSGQLTPGTHTIMVKVTGQKNAKATGTCISVDQFKVYSVPERPVVPACSSCHPARVAPHEAAPLSIQAFGLRALTRQQWGW